MKFNIRLMKEEDLTAVMQIEQEVYSDPWCEEMFYKEMEIEGSYILEGTKSSEIIGYYCGIKVLDEYSLLNIAVAKDYQGQGYGAMLLDDMIARCRANGVRRCFLEVRKSNKKGINLYSMYGFEITGTRKEYYRNPVEDALLMMLQIQ